MTRILPAALYATDSRGQRWRVYDVEIALGGAGGERRTVHQPPCPRAQYRVFVPWEGLRRSYIFATSECRDVDDDALQRQLTEALYLAGEDVGIGQPDRDLDASDQQ